MGVEVIIRDYCPADASKVIEVFRDSYNTLRRSKGGIHPDDEVDKMLKRSDKDILAMLTCDAVLYVAEVRETGEIVGIGAICNGWKHRLLNITYSKGHYVKEKFQRGKAGVNVGSMLRQATIDKAKSMGFRKICGHAHPESKGFHEKFGAKFLPAYDTKLCGNTVELKYYEFELRPSIWNDFGIELYAFRLIRLYYKVRRFLGIGWDVSPQ